MMLHVDGIVLPLQVDDLKQGNHAIAKMTARCAQYVSAQKLKNMT